jgi:hypothetical protein
MIYVQRIYDTSQSVFVYYSLGSVTTTPDPGQTNPNHGGLAFLLANTHVVVQKIAEADLTIEHEGITISSGSTNLNFTGGVDVTEDSGDVTIHVTGAPLFVVSPTNLSANQNNYNPTDLQTADTLRLNATTPVNITGIMQPTSGLPKRLSLFNVGSIIITLLNNSGSSLATNRFLFAGANDVALGENDCITLEYDSLSLIWRAT